MLKETERKQERNARRTCSKASTMADWESISTVFSGRAKQSQRNTCHGDSRNKKRKKRRRKTEREVERVMQKSNEKKRKNSFFFCLALLWLWPSCVMKEKWSCYWEISVRLSHSCLCSEDETEFVLWVGTNTDDLTDLREKKLGSCSETDKHWLKDKQELL